MVALSGVNDDKCRSARDMMKASTFRETAILYFSKCGGLRWLARLLLSLTNLSAP